MPHPEYRRVVFLPHVQEHFLDRVFSIISVSAAARYCDCSERTIRDWKRGKFLMPEQALKTLCRNAQLSIPKGISYRNQFWYVSKGARRGGIASLRKQGGVIGDSEKRLLAWRAWWREKGQFKKSSLIHDPLPIRKPRQSAKLAEFCGIMLGDGGISERQVTVTLHSIDDAAYGLFVSRLAKELFGTQPKKYAKQDSRAFALVISRTSLVSYLMHLGLVRGNKIRQRIDIPPWIKANHHYTNACIRGLVDTDGCIFTHRYKVKDKWYLYKKLSFTSASAPLITSVYSALSGLGFHPRICSNGRDVRLDSVTDMRRYFSLIGTHNPKHLKRYEM